MHKRVEVEQVAKSRPTKAIVSLLKISAWLIMNGLIIAVSVLSVETAACLAFVRQNCHYL